MNFLRRSLIHKVFFVSFISSIAVLYFSFFQNCSPIHHPMETENASLVSLDAFEKTLYPIILSHCETCHGTQQNPQFAVKDSKKSFDTIIQFNLVSLTNPDQSLIVKKIANGHSGFPTSIANNLKEAIQQWSLQAGILDTNKNPEEKVLFSYINQNILQPRCQFCHRPNGNKPKPDYTSYQTTMSTGSVVAGDPTKSTLYTKCKSGEMPMNGYLLTSEEISILEKWIQAGALNN